MVLPNFACLLARLRAQTRQRYARPRHDIEADLLPHHRPAVIAHQPVTSSWGGLEIDEE